MKELPGLERTMVIARRADGSLLLNSAIAMDDAAMREVEALGVPSILVVPNGWHRLDAFAYKARYPAVRVLCPRSQAGKVRQIVAVDGAREDLEDDGVVRAEVFDGFDREGVIVVTSGGKRTLVFGDTLMNVPHQRGLGGLIYRFIGASGGPKVHPIMKLMSKKKRLAAHLGRLADTPDVVRLIPGHGESIEDRVAEVLRDCVHRMS